MYFFKVFVKPLSQRPTKEKVLILQQIKGHIRIQVGIKSDFAPSRGLKVDVRWGLWVHRWEINVKYKTTSGVWGSFRTERTISNTVS